MVLHQIVEAVGAPRGPRTRHFHHENTLGGGELHAVDVRGLGGQLRGMQQRRVGAPGSRFRRRLGLPGVDGRNQDAKAYRKYPANSLRSHQFAPLILFAVLSTSVMTRSTLPPSIFSMSWSE